MSGHLKTTETLEAYDGLELYCETYPSPQPKGVIIALHDYAEHCGLYEPIFSRFSSEASLSVYAMDLRGHGRSPGDRAYIASFDDFLDDLDIFLARVRDREAGHGVPIYLLGQGLGATIAASFSLTRKPRLDGLILCGPLLDLPLSRLHRTLARFSGSWFPHVAPRELQAWIAPRIKSVAEGDQLVYRGPLQLGSAREILGACSALKTSTIHLPFPLLTLVGKEIEAAPMTETLQDAFLTADKTLLHYENMGANVLLHRERDQVVGDIMEWCDRVREERNEGDGTLLADEEEEEDDRL